MTHNITKRTLAGVMAVLCIAGTVPAGSKTNNFIGASAITAFADAKQETAAVVTTYEVSTLEEFLEAANSANDGDTIKLVDSFTVDDDYTITNGSTFTVDFNGNTIYFDGEGTYKVQSYLRINNADAHITFLDSGHGGGMSVINPCVVRLLMLDRGTVELLSGTYIGGLDTVRTNTGSAYVYVKGGYYDLAKEDDEGPFYRCGAGTYYLEGGYYTERSNMSDTAFDLPEEREYYETGYEEYVLGIRKIGAESMSDADIADIPDQKYTGSKVTPDLNITFGTRGMKKNVDYTVSYAENTEVGTATVYINGIGDFYGTVTKTFSIKKMPEYTIPADITAAYGSKLSEIKLPAASNGKWSWADGKQGVGDVGKKTFKAVFTPNDTKQYLTVSNIDIPVTVHHTYKKIDAVAATCNAAGNIEYYVCSDGKYYTDDKGINEVSLADTVVPAKGHSYDEPQWKWSDTSSTAAVTASATFICKDCGDTQSVNATVTSKVMDATYAAAGKRVYTATVKFGGKTYTDTKEIAIPQLKLTHVAAVAATCTKNGNIEYWFDEANNKYFTDAKGENEITKAKTVVKATGHSFGEPVWKWAEDYSYATLSFSCSSCNTISGMNALITSVTTEPTYTAEGKIVYTAKATFNGNTYTDTVEVKLDKLKYTAPKISYEKGEGSVKLSWTAVEGAEQYGIAGYVNGEWTMLDKCSETSNTLKNLAEGTEYKVAVVTKCGGKWMMDFSNAVTVTPKTAEAKLYPQVNTLVKDNKIGFKWNKIPGAEKYGIGVYQANKWKVVKQLDGSITTWTSPQVRSGKYRLVVLAKVNGQWVNTDVFKKAFYVTVK